MARPKSDDRRTALLEAAIAVFAEHGLGAPTSLISKTAKVSEGSLFTYFKTKDELINEVYREIRLDVSARISRDFPRKASVRDRLEHVFTRYVTWGVENPLARKTLKHVGMSNAITPEVRAEGDTLFAEVGGLERDAIAQRKLQHLTPAMASKALKALSEMTMDMVSQEPKRAGELTAAGFQMLWGALTSKP